MSIANKRGIWHSKESHEMKAHLRSIAKVAHRTKQ